MWSRPSIRTSSIHPQPRHETLQYRADIDGLRAIAVLGVLFYHAGLGFKGGFTGVDVFFVISGYLITSLIAASLADGSFSFLNFLERRARRIFPALAVVMAACVVPASLWFMPPEFSLFGRSMALAALSVSNFGFWLESGYFDSAAHFKPLLHTWSLGIEEQFYLLYPLVVVALWKRGTAVLAAVLAGLALCSLTLGIYWSSAKPEAAFFLLPARFWELAGGGILALLPHVRLRQGWPASLAAAAGLAAISGSYFFIDDANGFPGLVALLPVAGALLVILAGRSANIVSRLLGVAPLRSIGVISYSLYLVHWPLIVFLQYRSGHLLTTAEAVGVVLLSLAIACALWAFVEQPFRKRTVLSPLNQFAPAAAGAAVMLLAIGFIIPWGHGWPQRLPENVQAVYAAKADVSPFTHCVTEAKTAYRSDAPMRLSDLCALGAATGQAPDFLLWGDSHAAAIAPALEGAAAGVGRRGALAVHGGCPPLVDYDVPNPSTSRRESCRRFNAAVMEMIEREHIREVLLVGRWPRELLGVENGREGAFFDPAEPYLRQDRSAEVAGALSETLSAIRSAGATPVLVMDVPEPGYDVPVAMARALMRGKPFDVNPSRAAVEDRKALEQQVLEEAARRWNAPLIDLASAMCGPQSCWAEIGGKPQYVDADHLTRTAAHALAPLFRYVLMSNSGSWIARRGFQFQRQQNYW